MIPFPHVMEIALLMLAAYLGGCIIGYCAHLGFRGFAARPRLEKAVPAKAVPKTRVAEPAPVPTRRSAARRLAGAVEREDVQPIAAAATPAQQRPPDLPSPRQGGPDNLRQIKGIGPKTESALNDLGIYHFDQIATWTPAHIEWLEGRIAVRGRIVREQWVGQAVLLATATV